MLARLTRVLLAGLVVAPCAQAAEPLRLGLLRTLSAAPFFIAQERGYFANEGVDLTFRFFQAAQPVAAAAAAGDVDVGVTALTGGFFNLARKGTLKIIGGGLHEQLGRQDSAILASNRAFDNGLTHVEDLAGHSFAITQYGSSFHYILGRIAEAKNFDLKSVTLRPVQQIDKMMPAITSGQVDATIAIASIAKPLAALGQVHILGWVGDLVPYQITAVFARAALIATNPDLLRHFAAAYKLGINDYRKALLRLDADGHPVLDEQTDAVITLLTKYVFINDPDARRKIQDSYGYYDTDGALDVADVLNQARWFKAQGLAQVGDDASVLIDTQFLPTR